MRKINLSQQILFVIVCVLAISISVSAQDTEPEDEPTRSISSTDFQKQRKKTPQTKLEPLFKKETDNSSPQRKKELSTVANPKRVYKLVKRVPAKRKPTAQVKPSENGGKNRTNPTPKTPKTEEIGVTFWRLRPRNENTDGDSPAFRVRIGDTFENWTSARVASTTKFLSGDRVRFTIESSRSGYLYIINREFYKSGDSGDAMIIFPTLRTREGNNQVTAGSLVEIPSSKDSVSYFTIKPKRSDYAGEEIIVLISSTKLSDYEIALRAQPIGREKLDDWFEKWGSIADIYDAEDGEGIAATQTESEAATVSSRDLTQEEPLPQTIYKVQVEPTKPLLVSFQMQAVAAQ